MKLAHLILVHAHPKQLARLVKRLQHPHTDIYIHVDKRADSKQFVELQGIENLYFIKNRVEVRWGTYTIINATLNSMLEILDTGVNYSHINLMSAQDYPLRNANDIYTFFTNNADKIFIDMPEIYGGWPQGEHRTVNYNFGDYLFPGHYVLQYLVNFVGIKKKMPPNLKLYGRSQWFAITPEGIRYVHEYLEQHPKIKRYFRMSFAPDEFLFQTILGNSPFTHKLVDDNLRYIKFEDGNLHPNMLTIEDAIPLTLSGKLYARKFDINKDCAILNYLDWVAEVGTHRESNEIMGTIK